MIHSAYFSYDGVFSGDYGLQVMEFDPSTIEENEAFSPSLSTLKVPRLMRFYHGGIEYSTPPSCEFSIISELPILPEIRASVYRWLVGAKSFKPLQIHNEDMESFVFYCVFTKANTIYINGVCHGFRLTATFDSPYARGKATKVTVPGGTHIVTLRNKSDIPDGYVYPTVQYTSNSGIKIINLTDDASRAFTIESYGKEETVTIDCEMRLITGVESGNSALSRFTEKNWLRLRPGNNTLQITSSGSVTVTCPWYAAIGQ